MEFPSILEILSPNDPIRCVVLSYEEEINDKKKNKIVIKLSMRSSLVNRNLAFKHLHAGFPIFGCISSIEDHGYIVNVGINGVTCFLPSRNITSSENELKIGNCLINLKFLRYLLYII